MLVVGVACAIACVVVVRTRRPQRAFAGLHNETGAAKLLLYAGFVLVPLALIVLIGGAGIGDPPSEGDPCDPGQTPPPGFVCE